MSDDRRHPAEGFLQWYADLYGETWFVDDTLADLSTLKAAGQADSGNPKSPTISGGRPSPAPPPGTPLAGFYHEIKDCQKCPLGQTRKQFVFGSGNGDAEIMFIGEAPGADEDRQGLPFVGRSGQLLTKILAGIKLQRDDVYIANILKCRPPGNRDPLPLEVEQCSPYLHKQIEMIRPKILVALGRVAAQTLLNTDTSLGRMRKTVHQYRGIPLIVTYHPAYILRNMNALQDAIDDMRFAVETYRQGG